LFDHGGKLVAENVYWQSQQRDDVGDPSNDSPFELKQASWADMTPLNYMARVPLEVYAQRSSTAGENGVVVRLHNPTQQIAFFERAETMSTRDGDEILPISYTDNYVTVFPGETVELRAVVPNPRIAANWVRVTGYNTPPQVVEVSSVPR
jgi:exo-1,4-beta-D-glucosaminidase